MAERTFGEAVMSKIGDLIDENDRQHATNLRLAKELQKARDDAVMYRRAYVHKCMLMDVLLDRRRMRRAPHRPIAPKRKSNVMPVAERLTIDDLAPQRPIQRVPRSPRP